MTRQFVDLTIPSRLSPRFPFDTGKIWDSRFGMKFESISFLCNVMGWKAEMSEHFIQHSSPLRPSSRQSVPWHLAVNPLT